MATATGRGKKSPRRNTTQTALRQTSKLQKRRQQESVTDPFYLARVYLDAEQRDDGGEVILRFWRSEWLRWAEGRYAKVEDAAVRVALTGFIKRFYDENQVADKQGYILQVRQGTVSNALAALRSMVAVPDEVEQPVWLQAEPRGPFIALTNGLMDIGKLPDGQVEVVENSPLWFSQVALPVAYRPGAKCPRWLAFLQQMLEGDQQRIDFLQEWFGHSLVFNTSLQKFVVMEGEGANGKSVVLDILTALLGEENVSHVPLEMFGVRFQLTATLDKLANVCAEVGEIDKVAEGYLKQFTGGDRMHFDRKGISPVEAFPTARLILSTNNRPRFRDRSTGVWRRMIVVPFRVTIAVADQNPLLKEELKQELPGILLWALEGLTRVRARGRFTMADACQDAIDDYQQEANPARAFLVEQCAAGTGDPLTCSTLYTAYAAWAKENGFEVLDARQFGKEVKKAFPKVDRKRVVAGNARPWCYVGLTHVPCGPLDSYPDE